MGKKKQNVEDTVWFYVRLNKWEAGGTSVEAQWFDSEHPLQGGQVLSLIREVRFHMPCGAAKI